MKLLTILLFSLLFSTPEQPVHKPVADDNKALFQQISALDSAMFAAFNAHDLEKLMQYFDPSLEFYHDKGGLSNFEQTKAGFQRLFDNNKNTGLRRQMVAGTQEVYPIPGYGAIEVHLHQFCHLENGKMDCGTFKNLMIWKQSPDGWKITRVVSYDH